MFILSITLPNLSIPYMPFPVLLSTLIRSRFQAKPATLVIPNDFLFSTGGVLWYPVPKWILSPKLMWVVAFHCLHIFSFSIKITSFTM